MQPEPPRSHQARWRTQWPGALLFGLLFILALMIGAWALRTGTALDPSMNVATLEPEAPPPAPLPPPDPTPVLKASLDDLQADGTRLTAELAALGGDLKRKVEECRVAAAPPPPPPPPKPAPPKPVAEQAPAPSPPPAPAADLPADRWANRDLGALQGCWNLGRDAPTVARGLRSFGGAENCTSKAGRICFDANGRGQRQQTIDCPSTGLISCTAPVTGQFNADGTFRTTQPDVSCQGSGNPPMKWFGRTLSCRRTSDSQADCRDSGRPDMGLPAQDQEFRRAP